MSAPLHRNTQSQQTPLAQKRSARGKMMNMAMRRKVPRAAAVIMGIKWGRCAGTAAPPGQDGKGATDGQTILISICSPLSGSLTWTAQAMQGSKEWMVRWISMGCLTLWSWWLSCRAAS